jgi:hypothetical protein
VKLRKASSWPATTRATSRDTAVQPFGTIS